jgi:hypothetical protein
MGIAGVYEWILKRSGRPHALRISDFGFPSDFGFRVSDLRAARWKRAPHRAALVGDPISKLDAALFLPETGSWPEYDRRTRLPMIMAVRKENQCLGQAKPYSQREPISETI